jgi:predicted outer membrane repeat protein
MARLAKEPGERLWLAAIMILMSNLKSTFLALALALPGTTGLTASVVLTNSDPAALVMAIEQAGTVTLAFDGSVALTNTLVIATNTTVDATGHDVILDGRGQRHFLVNPGATLRLVHVTLANGRFGGSGIPGDPGGAGAIHNAGGGVELVDCKFTNNSGTFGGAISSADGQLRATNCVFANNLATGSGGGPACGGALAALGGTALLNRCVFTQNQALGQILSGSQALSANLRGNGGALYLTNGAMWIEGSLFSTNRAIGGWAVQDYLLGNWGYAGYGGALCNDSGHLEILNSTFIFNEAKGGGASGGAFGTPSSGGPGAGGGIYNQGEAVLLINCTLAANNALGAEGAPPDGAHGGAISGAAALVNVTIASNTVRMGDFLPNHPGGWGFLDTADGSSVSGTVSLTNTILFCSSGQTNASGTITNGGHNICSDASAQLAGQTNLITASTNLINWVPLGTVVANTNGLSRFEDSQSPQFSLRFYQVKPQSGQ